MSSEKKVREALNLGDDQKKYGFAEEVRLARLLKAVCSMSAMLHAVYLNRNADPLLADAIANWQKATGRIFRLMKEPKHLHGSVDWVDDDAIQEATDVYINLCGVVPGSISGRAKRWAERKLREAERSAQLSLFDDAGLGVVGGSFDRSPIDNE